RTSAAIVLAFDLRFRGFEVEMRRGTATLDAHLRLHVIGNVAVEERADECAEARFLRIVRGERSLLERMRQKSLRQILGIHLAPSARDAQVLVERLPVQRDEHVERARALVDVIAAEGENDAVPRCRKGHERGDLWMAPAVGLEPTTRGLTVRCSTN